MHTIAWYYDASGQLGAVEDDTICYDYEYDEVGNLTERHVGSGRPLDTDTGLYNYRARWYDPAVGRFVSEDPSGFAGGDARSVCQFIEVDDRPEPLVAKPRRFKNLCHNGESFPRHPPTDAGLARFFPKRYQQLVSGRWQTSCAQLPRKHYFSVSRGPRPQAQGRTIPVGYSEAEMFRR